MTFLLFCHSEVVLEKLPSKKRGARGVFFIARLFYAVIASPPQAGEAILPLACSSPSSYAIY